MKQNINLMQNPEDIIFDKNSEYSKEYLIQTLANLGQRIGIKGDSVAYKSFTFNDILMNSETYSAKDKIGYIEYIGDDNGNIKALFGITDKLNLLNSKVLDTSININNALYFNTELAFSIPVCGIEKYSKNSICVNNDNELTFILVGKKIGYNDRDENNAILMYYKFDIITNKLIACYKLSHYMKNEDDNNYYSLISIKNSNGTDSLSSRYEMNIKIFNSANLDPIYLNVFKNLFKFSNYYESGNIPFTLLNIDYVDINKLEYYNENKFDSNSAISVILNNAENNLYETRTINLLFDTIKNELLADEEEKSDAVEFFFKEYKLNINEEIFNINEDINKLYVNVFNYYNEKFFMEKRSTLVKRILSKIYEKSIDFKTILGRRLYVPLDYEFHYICNSNNDLNIYYSNNIYVTYVSLSTVDLSEFWDQNKNLVFDYELQNKLKIYNFEINYNKYIDNLINTIAVKEIYTMPYINANNNWSINDIDTKIKAVGEDAGNPNIIIIYNKDKNDNSDSYEIMNVISNKEKILTATFKKEKFNVNIALFDNTYDVNIECCAYVPEVDEYNYKYFKDSIILGISDLDCIDGDDYKERYKGSYVLTLWHIIEKKNGKLKFDYIKQSGTEYALSLGATVNLLNELSDSSVVNLNSQDLILLKSIVSNIAHERLNVNMNNWLIIKNKQSEEYQSNNEYANDLNTIFQYDDVVNVKLNHIVHSHSNKKYITDINNIPITNSLYPKYEYVTEEHEVSRENAKVITSKLAAVSTRNSKIVVNGNQITNVESLIERLKTISNETTINVSDVKTIQTTTLTPTNFNHYEYVFNSNVPTIDFKEVFNRNFNLLNRLNIISLDNNGTIYNAYIGTDYNETDKSTLHIGTSNLNINVGSDTLMQNIDKDKFNTHNTLSLDFDNIKLDAAKTVSLTKNIKQIYNINTVNYNIFDIKLIGSSGISFNEERITKYANTMFGEFIPTTAYIIPEEEIDKYSKYYLCINNIMLDNINKNINEYDVVNINVLYNDSTLGTTKEISREVNGQFSTVYFVPILNNSLFNDKVQNMPVIYSSHSIELMYYESSTYDSGINKTISTINIFISFK